MSQDLKPEDCALIGRVMPWNSSLTHFNDFRCGHDDLAKLLDAARAEGALYEPTDAEIREGESLDSVSYVIRKGETDQTAFKRAAHAEIARLRRTLIERAEGAPAAEGALLSEHQARDHLRILLGEMSVNCWAKTHGLTAQQVDSFLRGVRPLEPKLAGVLGLVRTPFYHRRIDL